ncbi:MAG: glycosyltransferase family 2 protein [Thermoguttaceae bacterium]|jgi:dolichol-phosphate mannosyltransferase
MNKLKLSVVIPAHNEEKNLPQTLTDLQETLRAERIPYEIIVVNDNSVDGTEAVIRSFMEADPRVRGVCRRPPKGFGRAVRAGLDAVLGDVVIVYMADASDHPADAAAYYYKIVEGYDCVFGSRFIRGSRVTAYPPLKRIVNRIVNKCMQWLFLCPLNDLTNAFKAYRTHVIRECGPFRASHFNITIEMALSAVVRKYNIIQVPISWAGRTWGSSNLNLRQMGRRYLSTLLKIYAEKLLIADDLLAERLAAHVVQEDRLAKMEETLAAAHLRLGQIEQRLEHPDDAAFHLTLRKSA